MNEMGGRSKAARINKGISTKLMVRLIHFPSVTVEIVSDTEFGLSSIEILSPQFIECETGVSQHDGYFITREAFWQIVARRLRLRKMESPCIIAPHPDQIIHDLGARRTLGP